MRKISWIVIHCSATPPETKVSSILNYWRNNLGWKNPGYHRIIEANGKVHELADFSRVTNGVRGFNQHSIHISYIGGIDRDGNPVDTRTEAQKAAILDCIHEALEWVMSHQIKIPHIVGHRDLYAGKACPSFNALKEYDWITLQSV